MSNPTSRSFFWVSIATYLELWLIQSLFGTSYLSHLSLSVYPTFNLTISSFYVFQAKYCLKLTVFEITNLISLVLLGSLYELLCNNNFDLKQMRCDLVETTPSTDAMSGDVRTTKFALTPARWRRTWWSAETWPGLVCMNMYWPDWSHCIKVCRVCAGPYVRCSGVWGRWWWRVPIVGVDREDAAIWTWWMG